MRKQGIKILMPNQDMEVHDTVYEYGCYITCLAEAYGKKYYLVTVDVYLPKFGTKTTVDIGYYNSYKKAIRKCRRVSRKFQERYEKQVEDAKNTIREFIGPFENISMKHSIRESSYYCTIEGIDCSYEISPPTK